MRGLKERIREAKDEEALNALLHLGDGYLDASPTTKRKWKTAAIHRLRELTTPPRKEKK